MIDFLIHAIHGIIETSFWEWFAVFTSITYVVLAAKQSQWCWLFAFASSITYVWLCYDAQLYLESILQFFYVYMAFHGWFSWNKSSITNENTIFRWKFKQHFFWLIGLGSIAIVIGFLFATFTQQAYPYVDSVVFVFSLFATFLVTKKVLENWLYWIVIDAASIFLYASRGLESSALLYVFFTGFAIYGYFQWKVVANKTEAQFSH